MPNRTRKSRRKQVLFDRESTDTPCLRFTGSEQDVRRWLIRRVAERAAVILAEGEQENGDE
jgi:hypothetical protein